MQSSYGANQTKPLKLAFIGGGHNSAVGYTHYLASRMDGFFEVAAGCFSRDPSVNKQTGEAFGVAENRVHSSIDALLDYERGSIDAICILTPTPDHAQTILKCLQAGFNVICEKAMATSVAECDQIQSVLSNSNLFFGLTFNYAGYPMVREARQMVISGRLGRIQQIYCEMPTEHFARRGADPQAWRKKDYTIPCVSLDLGVHVHHLVYYLTGGRRSLALQTRQASYGKVTGVVDTVAVLADYEDNLFASLMWGKAALGYRNGLRVRIFGEHGALEWYQMDPEVLHYSREDGSAQRIDRGQSDLLEASQQRYNRFKAGHPAGFVEAFANIYSDFALALAGDDRGSTAAKDFSAEVAAEGIAMMEAISTS